MCIYSGNMIIAHSGSFQCNPAGYSKNRSNLFLVLNPFWSSFTANMLQQQKEHLCRLLHYVNTKYTSLTNDSFKLPPRASVLNSCTLSIQLPKSDRMLYIPNQPHALR